MKNKLKKILALGGLASLIFGLFKKRKEVKAVAKIVEKDVKKVATDIKHSLHKRFLHIAKDYIVPHLGNNHKPKALRPKALTAYVVVILLVKVFVTGSLFFIYPNTGLVTSKITDQLYELINQERIVNDLDPLIINEELIASAERKVQDMVDQQYFSHIGPGGTKPWEWINKDNYNFTHMGENLAMDFSSATVVHSAFLNSPSHKANILHKDYTNIGMALVVAELEGRETIVLVQFYGKQKALPTLSAAITEPENIVVEPEVVIHEAVEEVPVPVESVEEVISDDLVDSIENIVEDISIEENEIIIENQDETITEPVSDIKATTTTSTSVARVDGVSFAPSAQLVVADQPGVQKGLVDMLISWSRNFMTLMLVVVSMLLIVNVSVKTRIQHSHVIAHSLIVIGFIMVMLFSRLHILEKFVL